MSNPALWPTWPPNTWCLLLMSSIRFDYLQYKFVPKVVLCYCAAARKESNVVVNNEGIYHTHIDNVIKEGLPITDGLAKYIMVWKILIRFIDSTHEAVIHFNWHRPGNVQCSHLSSFFVNNLSLNLSLKFLTNYFLDNIHTHLRINEALHVAGGFDGILTETAWFVQAYGQCQPHSACSRNAEETDTKIWLHVKQTECGKILLLSPDTDVYHIGMAFIRGKQVIVQISPVNSR